MSQCGDREETFIWMWKHLHVCEYRNAEKSRLPIRTTGVFCFSLSILFVFLQCAMTFTGLAAEDNEQKKHQSTFPQHVIMPSGILKLED